MYTSIKFNIVGEAENLVMTQLTMNTINNENSIGEE